MPIPPGGLIPSGIGGCLVTGNLGQDLSAPDVFTETNAAQLSSMLLDVGRWQLQELFLTAECTHSGTWGAISRRRVAYDFRYSCELPYDYNNPADVILAGAETVALRFNLADAKQELLLALNGADQRFYLAPSAILEAAIPVLDARGDVIRMTCHGSGNGLIFVFPEEASLYSDYVKYMTDRGWNV